MVAHIALGENVNINKLCKNSLQDQHIQGQYKHQHIHSDMQFHQLHELTGKENSSLHGCEVSFSCQQFQGCIGIFQINWGRFTQFYLSAFVSLFSSRSLHSTDWSAHTLFLEKEQIIIMRFFFFKEECQNFLKFLSVSPLHFVAVVQLLSPVWLFATSWTAAPQVPLSSSISWSLLKFMSIELVMLSNHLTLWCPFLLLPSIFPSIRVFSLHLLSLFLTLPSLYFHYFPAKSFISSLRNFCNIWSLKRILH